MTHHPYTKTPARRLGPALLLCCLAIAACSPPEQAPEPRPDVNVLVVLVDTLRADALGAYGAARPTSPRFDALAAEGFLFEQARAQASCTFPSVNSILTGVMPTRFFDRPDPTFLGIPEEIASLPERLSAEGYATAAVSASPIVRATPSSANPHGGFGTGFDRFDETCLWRPADCVNKQAFEHLETLPEPFFFYLHYMDPHDPYNPPSQWKRRFATEPYPDDPAVAAGDPNEISTAINSDRGAGGAGGGDGGVADGARGEESPAEGVDPEAVAHLRDLYDDEVAYFDSRLGRLVDRLAERGLLERTVLVVLSDHGESFLEHGAIKHCYSLWDTEIRTPLLIRLPEVLDPPKPRRIATSVANLDVVPTVLDYLGLDAGPLAPEGKSLRPAIEDGARVHDAVFAAWAGSRAAVDDRFKLLYRLKRDRADDRLELYDVHSDPGELVDLSDERPRPTRTLARRLQAWMERTEHGEGTGGDARAIDTLRGLGYLQ